MKNLQTSTKEKTYKHQIISNNSNLRIVSMIPGDLMVAGCLFFYIIFLGFF